MRCDGFKATSIWLALFLELVLLLHGTRARTVRIARPEPDKSVFSSTVYVDIELANRDGAEVLYPTLCLAFLEYTKCVDTSSDAVKKLEQQSGLVVLPRLFRILQVPVGEYENLTVYEQGVKDSKHGGSSPASVRLVRAQAQVKIAHPKHDQVVVRNPKGVELQFLVSHNFQVGRDGILCIQVAGKRGSCIRSELQSWAVQLSGLNVGWNALMIWLISNTKEREIVADSGIVKFYIAMNDVLPNTVMIDSIHGKMLVQTGDDYIGTSLIEYGEWSQGEVNLFRKLVMPGDVVFDVGANLGAFALTFSEIVGARGKVFAFEPQRAVYYLLCGNVAVNQRSNIYPENLCIGLDSGPAVGVDLEETQKQRGNFGAVSFSPTRPLHPVDAWMTKSSEEKVSKIIQRVSLDEFVGNHDDIDRVDFIKIDVEGMELDVLQGGIDVIKRFRPILFVESDQAEEYGPLLRFLRNEIPNYELAWSIEPLYNRPNYRANKVDVFPLGLASYNILAVPKEKSDVLGLLPRVDPKESHPLFDMNSLAKFLSSLEESEFRMYSQNGEDGVLFALFNRFGVTNKFFIEFGVQDGTECNTRMLRETFHWSGVMFDGEHSEPEIGLFKHWITAENILELFREYKVPSMPDLVSIDIDFNDYWVTKAILESSKEFRPRIFVVEVNSKWGDTLAQTVPYDPLAKWDGTDFHGASVEAFRALFANHDYSLVYCETHGVNCFFVKNTLLGFDAMSSEHQELVRNLTRTKARYKAPRYFGYDGWSHPSSSRV